MKRYFVYVRCARRGARLVTGPLSKDKAFSEWQRLSRAGKEPYAQCIEGKPLKNIKTSWWVS